MKIYLSIDFDFWVRPRDPISLAETDKYSKSIDGWILRYLHYDIEKWNVSGSPTPLTLFNMLKKRLDFNIKEMRVKESHKDAYDFFKDKDPEDLILHLDSHSDQEISSRLYCGNWITFLRNPVWWIHPTWVDPDDFYYDKRRTRVSTFENLDIKGMITDIFICRSGGWVPPHLDPYFFEFVRTVERFGKVVYNIKERRLDLKTLIEERKWVRNYT